MHKCMSNINLQKKELKASNVKVIFAHLGNNFNKFKTVSD